MPKKAFSIFVQSVHIDFLPLNVNCYLTRYREALQMAELKLDHIYKIYDNKVTAVSDFNLTY